MTQYPEGTTEDRYNHEAAEHLSRDESDNLYRLWKEERHEKTSAALAPLRAEFKVLGVSVRPPFILPSRDFQLSDEMFEKLERWTRRDDLSKFVREQTLFKLTRHGGERHIESLVELLAALPSGRRLSLKEMMASEIGRIVKNSDVELLRKALTDPANGDARFEMLLGLGCRRAKNVREFLESVRAEDPTLEPGSKILNS